MGREFENLTLEVSEPIQKLAILNLFCLGYLRSAIVIFNLELDAPVVGGYTVCLGRPHHPSASCFLPVCSPGCIKTKIYSPLSLGGKSIRFQLFGCYRHQSSWNIIAFNYS